MARPKKVPAAPASAGAVADPAASLPAGSPVGEKVVVDAPTNAVAGAPVAVDEVAGGDQSAASGESMLPADSVLSDEPADDQAADLAPEAVLPEVEGPRVASITVYNNSGTTLACPACGVLLAAGGSVTVAVADKAHAKFIADSLDAVAAANFVPLDKLVYQTA